MKFDLMVTHEFGSYTIGQRITDAAEVKDILAGTNASKTVKVAQDTRSDDGKPAKPSE